MGQFTRDHNFKDKISQYGGLVQNIIKDGKLSVCPFGLLSLYLLLLSLSWLLLNAAFFWEFETELFI